MSMDRFRLQHSLASFLEGVAAYDPGDPQRISVRDLADLLGISKSHVHRLMRGESRITPALEARAAPALRDLAVVFDRPVVLPHRGAGGFLQPVYLPERYLAVYNGYARALEHFARTGDASRLAPYRGQVIIAFDAATERPVKVVLDTDPKRLREYIQRYAYVPPEPFVSPSSVARRRG